MSLAESPESVIPTADAPTPRYWLAVIARAVVAAVVAIAITFSADHSAPFGFLTFGALALASAIVVTVGAVLTLDRGIERSLFIASGLIGAAAGAVGLASTGAGLPFLLFLVSAWAALTGFLELYLGLRARRTRPVGKDWLFVGAVTAALAVVVLLVPTDFTQAYTGPDEVERFLTASVIVVGAVGAYAAIIAVYLAIAALSLKWAVRPAASTPESSN